MKVKENRFARTINIKNKRASFEYHLIEKFVAGIVLTGTEIKSIREGKVHLQDGFCVFHGDELFLHQVSISPYKQGGHYNHENARERKLLLKKRELKKLKRKLEEKGLSIIPLRLFINEKGLAKVEISVAKGKKLYDKRESIKEKDIKRNLHRIKI